MDVLLASFSVSSRAVKLNAFSFMLLSRYFQLVACSHALDESFLGFIDRVASARRCNVTKIARRAEKVPEVLEILVRSSGSL